MPQNILNNNSLASMLGSYGQPVVGLSQPQQGFGLNQALNVGASDQFAGALSNLGQQQGGLLERLGSLGGGGASGLLGLGQIGLGAFGSIGGLMNSRNMLGLARDQFNHARDVTNTNLTNQIQSYNTALSDRARTRAAMEGRDMESANKYIEENKLRR